MDSEVETSYIAGIILKRCIGSKLNNGELKIANAYLIKCTSNSERTMARATLVLFKAAEMKGQIAAATINNIQKKSKGSICSQVTSTSLPYVATATPHSKLTRALRTMEPLIRHYTIPSSWAARH